MKNVKEYFLQTNDKCVCLICCTSVAVGKKCNVEKYYTTVHKDFENKFPAGRDVWLKKVTKGSFAETTIYTCYASKKKKKKQQQKHPFKLITFWQKTRQHLGYRCRIGKGCNGCYGSLFREFKNKLQIMAAIHDVQLGPNTVTKRVSALSTDVCQQLDGDLHLKVVFNRVWRILFYSNRHFVVK